MHLLSIHPLPLPRQFDISPRAPIHGGAADNGEGFVRAERKARHHRYAETHGETNTAATLAKVTAVCVFVWIERKYMVRVELRYIFMPELALHVPPLQRKNINITLITDCMH